LSQSEETVFLENPSNHLGFETQVTLRKFLEQALDNGKVIDQRFFDQDKENDSGFKISRGKFDHKGVPMAPRILFPKPADNKTIKEDPLIPESPHIYTSSPSVNPQTSPLRDLLSVITKSHFIS